MSFIVQNIEYKTPEVSWPDCDSDVSSHPITKYDRDTLVDYLADKYGQDCIAYVGNRNYYSLKSALIGLGQVYEIPSQETIKCSKEFNPDISIEDNIRASKAVEEYFGKYPFLIEKVNDIAGTMSSSSIHAGGVVLSDSYKPLNTFCALQRPAEGKRVATSWTKKEVEKIGLIKYDILGVSSVGHIHYARELAGLDPYVDPDEESEVFEYINEGAKHKNIFQFESALGKKALIDMMPMNISELANASGIIRVVGTKAGRNVYDTYKYNVTHRDEWKDSIRNQVYDDHTYEVACRVLEDSFGVMIYQEQIANMVKYLSGEQKSFTDGNNFRKFLDKHKVAFGTIDNCQGSREAIKAWHTNFMKGLNEYILPFAGKDGWDCEDETVQAFLKCEIGDDNTLPVPETGLIGWIISAAAYLFSKLHAVAYSINTYNMMWLKYHYPCEFWIAALTCDSDDLDKVTSYISAIWSETPSIKVLPPDVNKSDTVFLKEDNNIRYALSALQGLGKSADLIVQERQAHGEYNSIDDFMERVNTSKVNKKVIFNLICANAFNQFGAFNEVIKYFTDHYGFDFEVEEAIDEKQLAKLENTVVGVNISYIHPILKQASMYHSISELEDGMSAVCAVKILKKTIKTTKAGKPYSLLYCMCLNSGQTFNLFDWDNKEITDEYLIVSIDYKNGFYSYNKPRQFNFANKSKFQRALRR